MALRIHLFKAVAGLVAAAVLIPVAIAQSGKTACAMTYVQFEGAIAHIDVETCPAELAPAGSDRFCRAGVGGDQVHVYAFDHAGDKCLVAMRSFDKDAFKLEVGKTKN